ncbi:glycosyltransferase family 4 protein [Chitinophaga pinensis]|uniref:Glycosyl transferase group 1 n=1 Tax=Chitinophaga pinensis (strain ATCC 43595 / DSM 2588 / LMG 13176 / NBRC 15968 / NCIMB 11800 / UQM 2034) TaxID=485918 RepID=A0A979G312_CHIPD|nr:glycosyltransferase family 4 protein [Chitinophaga pinensis]ACU59859.1 glycosyl transferase group 1 [Chitinophaga pinensis DSM 2588]
MVIISHPTGNANLRAAVAGLADAGILSEFHTAIASFPGSAFGRLAGFGPLSEIKRRGYEPRLEAYTRLHPWHELGRLAATKAGFKSLTRQEKGMFSVDAVYHAMDRRVAARLKSVARKANAVYAYEDGAMLSFREADRLGLKRLYDLPIGYWRASQRLLSQELERWPAWKNTISSLSASQKKLDRKDEELQLADRIFVASSFTAKTLKDYPGQLAQIDVIPYGFPAVSATRDYDKISGRPLKILFVGGLSQRKGIADLFAAADKLGNAVELTIVGKKMSDNCPALDKELAKHTYIPSLAHADILKLMRTQDVFIFPSLFEGFGLVITEAMSQGTPVITTDRTAGPDLITDGKNGWLTATGSTDALYDAIAALLNNPDSVAEAGLAAMEKARSRPWAVYGQELAAAISKV